jgi:hypothetical protein
MASGQRVKMDDILAYGFVMAYKVPVLMGYGAHWELAKEEAKQLGSTLKACLETLPEERKRKIMKRVENYVPWCALVAFAGIMTYGRYAITRELMRIQRHERQFNVRDIRSAPTPAGETDGPKGTPDASVKGNDKGGSSRDWSGGKDLPFDFPIT